MSHSQEHPETHLRFVDGHLFVQTATCADMCQCRAPPIFVEEQAYDAQPCSCSGTGRTELSKRPSTEGHSSTREQGLTIPDLNVSSHVVQDPSSLGHHARRSQAQSQVHGQRHNIWQDLHGLHCACVNLVHVTIHMQPRPVALPWLQRTQKTLSPGDWHLTHRFRQCEGNKEKSGSMMQEGDVNSGSAVPLSVALHSGAKHPCIMMASFLQSSSWRV